MRDAAAERYSILLLLSHPDWVLEPVVPSGWRSLTHGVQESFQSDVFFFPGKID